MSKERLEEINSALEEYSSQSRQITFLVKDKESLARKNRELRIEISRLTEIIENAKKALEGEE